jgi:hypothetical protein
MEMRSSPVRSTTLELNGREGGGPAARGAALSSGKAPGPVHEDRKLVRWLGIDDVAEIEVRRGGGDLPEADKKCWPGRDVMGGAHFIRVRMEGDDDGMA